MNKEALLIETELLRKVSAGDEDAFGELYNLIHKKVFFYLYRLLKDRDTAEDLLVETFTVVWKGARDFKGRSQVMTWILGIARNLAMDELRKRKVHESIDNHQYLSDGAIPDTEHLDRQRFLKKAMSGLSTKHKEMLDLVFFHEMNYPEISEMLNIPEGTVKTRVFYAKDALREALNSMGVKRDEI